MVGRTTAWLGLDDVFTEPPPAWHCEDWKPWAPIWVAECQGAEATMNWEISKSSGELPIPKVGRMGNWKFLMICVGACPLCAQLLLCWWLRQLPKRGDASVEPTSIGPGGNLLCTRMPRRHVASLIFTRLHATDNKCNIPVSWSDQVTTRRGLYDDVAYVTLSHHRWLGQRTRERLQTRSQTPPQCPANRAHLVRRGRWAGVHWWGLGICWDKSSPFIPSGKLTWLEKWPFIVDIPNKMVTPHTCVSLPGGKAGKF